MEHVCKACLSNIKTGWWFNPSEKYESQLGSLFQTEWKDKIHDPNHQPEHNVLNNGTYLFLLMEIHAGPEKKTSSNLTVGECEHDHLVC